MNRSLFLLFIAFGISSFAQEKGFNIQESDFHESLENPYVVQGCTRKHPQGVNPVGREGNHFESPACVDTYCSPCYIPKSHIEIGGTYSYVHMKPEDLEYLTGNLGGIQALYEYQRANRIYQAVTFAWRQGSLEGDDVKRSLFDIDTQGRLGFTFGGCQQVWLITAFTGLGYRHMGEDVSSVGNSVDFFYNTLYIPVGFLVSGEVFSDWYLGWNFQWRPQVYPTLKIDPLKGARWITECTLANFLVEFPLTYVLCRENHFAIILKPFFEYWQDGRTTAKAPGLVLDLPKNTYLFGGVALNVRYSF